MRGQPRGRAQTLTAFPFDPSREPSTAKLRVRAYGGQSDRAGIPRIFGDGGRIGCAGREARKKAAPNGAARSLGRKRPRRAAGPRRHRDLACPSIPRCVAQNNRGNMIPPMHSTHAVGFRSPSPRICVGCAGGNAVDAVHERRVGSRVGNPDASLEARSFRGCPAAGDRVRFRQPRTGLDPGHTRHEGRRGWQSRSEAGLSVRCERPGRLRRSLHEPCFPRRANSPRPRRRCGSCPCCRSCSRPYPRRPR